MRAAFASVLILTAALTAAVASPACAQFEVQDSTTASDLRGVSAPGNGVAWASGTHGTVVRTEDGGYMWQGCAMPPNAEQLDFRGIQAFDDRTALVMSSGKGSLSRIYKTTDGCQSWKLVFTSPDADGFFDAMQFASLPGRDRGRIGKVIGDPVKGKFPEFYTYDYGVQWTRGDVANAASARDGEALFAASNSSLLSMDGDGWIFVTGGKGGSRSRVLSEYVKHDPHVSWNYVGGDIPLHVGESAGAFAIASNSSSLPQMQAVPPEPDRIYYVDLRANYVVVGGDYKKPDQVTGTAARSNDGGQHWLPAQTQPHGYRSSVAYDAGARTWVTVGPNGTDISTDNGLNWRPLRPMPGDAPDTDRNWNALALPWVVGPHGRIGKLHDDALHQNESRVNISK